MCSLRIDLSQFPERFKDDSRELIISNNVNFIFGKNGTGKTTISKAITNNLSDNYNIHVFSGFDGVVGENFRLDAVSLGTKNATIQNEINAITEEIKNISSNVEKPIEKKENLYTKYEKSKSVCNKQKNEIENFYTNSAREIKNKKCENINIAVTSYNKDKLKNEIHLAKTLTTNEETEYKATIKAEEKKEPENVIFPKMDLINFLENTNNILRKFVSSHQIIEELDNNIDKQNFAKEGMRIHNRDSVEKCAFCGNIIDENRWKLLGNYFNDEVKKFENEIDHYVSLMNQNLSRINNLKEINTDDFYIHFENRINRINSQIRNLKEEYKGFITFIVQNLITKKKNLFSTDKEISYNIPNDFSEIQIMYNDILKENISFTIKLSEEQENAKTALRLFELKKLLDEFKYTEKILKYNHSLELEGKARDDLSSETDLLNAKKNKINELLLQTKDERIIAERINKKLQNMGVSSFSLELVVDDVKDQKGQYKIKGYNGNIRSIIELSKGEKNIIAFLYFILSLEEINTDEKPKIIVLDDPMTSNDDTMQYLMIGEAQRYYREISGDNFFINLTHNCHFYLNIRPNTTRKYKVNGVEVSYYEKYGNYHLYSDGKQTTFHKIMKGKKDFKTNYEMLWNEFQFLYDSNEPNLMLNVCRKICETYMSFTKKGIEQFYGDNTNAKKLFDVNQHSIDDMDAEQNGRTKEEIRDILKALFEQNNAMEHFENYFHTA